MAGIIVALEDRELGLADVDVPLQLDALVPGSGPWEVEIGFGKGRYLLQRAEAEPDVRFLGIEVAGEYFRRVRRRIARRGLGNVLLLRGEALYLLAAILPTSFAAAAHVYFPDPWPKARHHGRRLFDAETVDLVTGVLGSAGVLFVATDFLEYGDAVAQLVEELPGARLRRISGPWEGEPRTNYEAKYIREGRPIRRFEITRDEGRASAALHPKAVRNLKVAIRSPEDRGDEEAAGEALAP